MKITLFIPCFIDMFFPQVGVAIVRILERLGHSVECPEEPACCGQPGFNTGYWHESIPVAIKAVQALRDAEVVVIPSGSCGAMMKNFYPELLAGTEYAQLAAELSGRIWEFSQFLVDKLGLSDVGARFEHKVTIHDGCHGLRELGGKQAPRTLLRQVKGLEIVEMFHAETCCGFGGTFSAKFPAISTAMGETKCASALETGADCIVTNDSSCLMHLGGLAKRRKMNLPMYHLAEVLVNQ